MADFASESFELVGDPDVLPDAFFDALAGLLLSIAPPNVTEVREDNEERLSHRPAASFLNPPVEKPVQRNEKLQSHAAMHSVGQDTRERAS